MQRGREVPTKRVVFRFRKLTDRVGDRHMYAVISRHFRRKGKGKETTANQRDRKPVLIQGEVFDKVARPLQAPEKGKHRTVFLV